MKVRSPGGKGSCARLDTKPESTITGEKEEVCATFVAQTSPTLSFGKRRGENAALFWPGSCTITSYKKTFMELSLPPFVF